MKASERTLEQLLSGPVVHVTPSFQRPYGGADGAVAFRGFRGAYRLSWRDASGAVRTADATVS